MAHRRCSSADRPRCANEGAPAEEVKKGGEELALEAQEIGKIVYEAAQKKSEEGSKNDKKVMS